MGVRKHHKPRRSSSRLPSGCLKWLLILLFWPFALIYYYVKWCIGNNQRTADKPLFARPWFIVSIILAVVFGLSAAFGRSPSTAEPAEDTTVVVESATPTPAPTVEPTAEPTSAPTPEPTVEPTPEPTPEITPEPTPEPTPEITPAPVQEETQAQTQPQEDMVWIASTGNGKKYHSYSGCSNMKNPIQVTLSDAIARGYERCSKCH